VTLSAAICPEPVRRWLGEAVQLGASDLHLVVSHPPLLQDRRDNLCHYF
jgi:hypothetical protein